MDNWSEIEYFVANENEDNLPEAGTLHLTNSKIDLTESQFVQVEPESGKFTQLQKNQLPTIEEWLFIYIKAYEIYK